MKAMIISKKTRKFNYLQMWNKDSISLSVTLTPWVLFQLGIETLPHHTELWQSPADYWDGSSVWLQ